MSYFRLDCWWPLKNGLGTEKVTKIVGREPSDSGAGFGARDVGWHYKLDEENEANAACKRLKEAGYDCEVTRYDDNHRKER